LPQTLVIPDVMTLTTLAYSSSNTCRPHGRAVARDIGDAAHGGDPAEATMTLRVALLIEGVACRAR
jgi:hypothetical protein